MPTTKPAREVEFDVLGKDEPRAAGGRLKDDPFIALMARLMDTIFVIPGTNIRFGLDPIIGLLPGLGTTASSVVSLVLIAMSARRGVPKVVLSRMAVNVLVNAAIDSVPVVGDILSVFFRSNARNYELLQKHAGTVRPSTRGDWWFIVALVVVVLLAISLIFIGMVTLVRWVWSGSHVPGLF